MNSKITRLSAAAIAAISVAAGFSAAHAGVSVIGDTQWVVNSKFTDGTTLTGNFYVNVYGYFDINAPWSLTTQSSGGFTGFTYDASDVYVGSGSDFIDLEPGYQQDLHLQFADNLTVPVQSNAIVAGSSYECQSSYSCYVPSGGITRYIDAASPGSAAGSVPEPATWAMMILGFVGLGGLMRGRRRRDQVLLGAI